MLTEADRDVIKQAYAKDPKMVDRLILQAWWDGTEAEIRKRWPNGLLRKSGAPMPSEFVKV